MNISDIIPALKCWRSLWIELNVRKWQKQPYRLLFRCAGSSWDCVSYVTRKEQYGHQRKQSAALPHLLKLQLTVSLLRVFELNARAVSQLQKMRRFHLCEKQRFYRYYLRYRSTLNLGGARWQYFIPFLGPTFELSCLCWQNIARFLSAVWMHWRYSYDLWVLCIF